MRYFGTDGIRGVANDLLTPELAYKVGAYLGHKYDMVVIGKDTRISSSMLESALASGISAYGAKAYTMGYTSTPALAYTTKTEDFDVGIMISASHNPYYDNGIKIFAKDGLKIDSTIEKEIEDYIDGKISLDKASGDKIGEIYDYKEASAHYVKWLHDHFYTDTSGMKIAFDLANGGATYTFDLYKKYFEADIAILNDRPDGININVDCGSTHLDRFKGYVKGGFDMGFAFDGDADRVLAIDENGEVVDGDKLMYILARYLKKMGKLHDDMVVTTVMSNLGLYKAFKRVGIQSVKTSVGDKNVADMMINNDYDLGGEQSGHIIIKEDGMFGDGLKTALRIIKILKEENKSLKEIADDVKIYPQLLVNKKTEYKEDIMNDGDILAYVQNKDDELGDDGRILVRPSGTEPLIRVMVEADSDEKCQRYVDDILGCLKDKGYIGWRR